MYFLKTRLKHILYNSFTDKEFSRFMKLRAITCQLGKIPSDKQIATVCPRKTYESIVKALANEGQSIVKVLEKDIEDATEVEAKRDYWKRKKREQREKVKGVNEDKFGHSEQEIRVDKIRVDKSRVDTNTQAFFQNAWNDFFNVKLLKLSEKRKRKLKARITNDKDFKTHFEVCLQKIKNSDFLSGRSSNWKATFDWLIENDNNYIKVLENQYENNKRATKAERNIDNAREYIESVNSEKVS